MSDTRLLGRYGEALAAEHYRSRKYKICSMNFRTRYGEVDVIASNQNFIVFSEVKLRKNADFASAKEQVTPAKQKRIIAAASAWLQLNPTNLQPRFDVVEIYAPEGVETKDPEINILENAFSADI